MVNSFAEVVGIPDVFVMVVVVVVLVFCWGLSRPKDFKSKPLAAEEAISPKPKLFKSTFPVVFVVVVVVVVFCWALSNPKAFKSKSLDVTPPNPKLF